MTPATGQPPYGPVGLSSDLLEGIGPSMRSSDGRLRRVSAVVAGLAMIGVVTGLGGGAGAIDGGSISPLTLSASGQEFTITYTGKTVDPATPNLIVAQCIADDTKVGFDTEIDCSPLSLVNYSDPGAPSGTIVYGGRPSNPFAPFVGIDVNNGEWSVCDPASGVTNYQTGFFRLADFPSDTADDFFIPFTCEGAAPATTTTTIPATTTTIGESTTTTALGETTTTTIGETTTTTLGDGTPTTTAPGDTTTTTTPTGVSDPTPDGSDGGNSGGDESGGILGDALARTGSSAAQMVKLALLLVYVGFLFSKWGGPRGGQTRGWPGTAPRRDRGTF